MFGWFKRKTKPEHPAVEVPLAAPAAPSTIPVNALPAAAKAVPALAKQAVALPSAPGSPVSATGAAVRALAGAGPNKPLPPEIGMPAIKLSPAKAQSMTVVGVQAKGRRVLAKAAGSKHVYAFIRRPDASYRLEGARVPGGERLILGATL